MDDPKPWLTLARAPGLHAGQLDRPGTGTLRASDLPFAAPRGPGSPRAEPGHHRGAEAPRPGQARRRRALARARTALPRHLGPAPTIRRCSPPSPTRRWCCSSKATPTALSLPQLAIVGSRNPTPLGRDTAEQFARHLALAGLAITSGLALGIDAAGHRGALQADGRTVAVLGCGLDTIYPREQRRPRPSTSSPTAARWSPTCRRARRRSGTTSRAATASSAACRSARWSSRRRCRAAR